MMMMRNGQNKRMRGRNRSNNNNNSNNSSHNRGHHHNPLTRVYESNGPDVKIRGTAHHIAEKYMQLARDASSSGDHVTAEAHHQHAEHYLRLIATAQEQFRQQNPHYQAPPPPGSEGSFEDSDENAGQPAQAQQNFGNQPNPQPQAYGGQPPQPYGGQPPQPYGGQSPQQNMRPPQQQQPSQHQPQPQPHFSQPQPQPQLQPPAGGDVGGLPSFITGGQPPQPNPGPNGHDGQGDRYSMHRRRRRHRGPPNAPGLSGDAPEIPGSD